MKRLCNGSTITAHFGWSSMNNETPKGRLLEVLGNLRRLSFSRRPAANVEEGSDAQVLWGVRSLGEVVDEADRRFGTATKRRPRRTQPTRMPRR
jgi:hypothetical protein